MTTSPLTSGSRCARKSQNLVFVFFHPRFPRGEVLADDYPQVKLARLDHRVVAVVQQHEPRRRVRGETFRRLVVDHLLNTIERRPFHGRLLEQNPAIRVIGWAGRRRPGARRRPATP